MITRINQIIVLTLLLRSCYFLHFISRLGKKYMGEKKKHIRVKNFCFFVKLNPCISWRRFRVIFFVLFSSGIFCRLYRHGPVHHLDYVLDLEVVCIPIWSPDNLWRNVRALHIGSISYQDQILGGHVL